MHHPGNRIQDTTNEVLRQLREEADLLQLNWGMRKTRRRSNSVGVGRLGVPGA
jgi:hypothetical protein